jgi:hypothetical protein
VPAPRVRGGAGQRRSASRPGLRTVGLRLGAGRGAAGLETRARGGFAAGGRARGAGALLGDRDGFGRKDGFERDRAAPGTVRTEGFGAGRAAPGVTFRTGALTRGATTAGAPAPCRGFCTG